jgi:hypothetical protein
MTKPDRIELVAPLAQIHAEVSITIGRSVQGRQKRLLTRGRPIIPFIVGVAPEYS